jgi:hypothetical protein
MAWMLGASVMRPTIVRAFGLVLLTGIVSSVVVLGLGI